MGNKAEFDIGNLRFAGAPVQRPVIFMEIEAPQFDLNPAY
jgi:hypothetical protein